MIDYKLGEVEMLFTNIIWENEPLSSGELVKLANDELEWKKSTTYTIIKKLSEKGIIQNDKGLVTSLISKEEYISLQSNKFVDDTFSGSLPNFLASFSKGREISNKEFDEIQQFINNHRNIANDDDNKKKKKRR